MAFFNRAGGVGKTTAALSFSGVCARAGLKVLVVDLDSQCNLTESLLDHPADETVVSLFESGKFPVVHVKDNLDLLPGSENIVIIESQMDKPDDRLILLRHLNKLRSKYDLIVLDCPPALGWISVNALTACDFLFVPMHADKKSYDSLARVAEACYQAATPTRINGIFFNLYNPRENLTKKIESLTRAKYGTTVLQSTIRKCVKVSECAMEHTDVTAYAPGSNANVDYTNLTNEILSIVLPESKLVK